MLYFIPDVEWVLWQGRYCINLKQASNAQITRIHWQHTHTQKKSLDSTFEKYYKLMIFQSFLWLELCYFSDTSVFPEMDANDA